MLNRGDTFGRWTVLRETIPYISPNSKARFPRYMCSCICGNEKSVRESSLVSGESKSCGCLAREEARNRVRTHGLSKHPLYQTWVDMNRRCYEDSRKDYKHYGGRGIKVCDEWRGSGGLNAFISDMFDSYEDGLELDRVDVNGDYRKENCRWATRRTQVINRRQFDSVFDTRLIDYNGKTLCISQWADELNINKSVLSDRLNKLGWSVEKAFSTSVKPREILVNIKGEVLSLKHIFKYPTNLQYHAGKFKITAYQLVANMFYNIAVVDVLINREMYTIEPAEDMTKRLRSEILADEFFAKYGVDLC